MDDALCTDTLSGTEFRRFDAHHGQPGTDRGIQNPEAGDSAADHHQID